MSWLIGVDTGGTFTDLVATDTVSGAIRTAKVPSTPDDPSRAVLAGLQQLVDGGLSPAAVSFFAHGTTVSTNAAIQRKGARVGLLISAGTNAVYLARRSRQPWGFESLDANFPKPPLLVPARHTREIPERLAFDGSVVEPLDEAAVLLAVGDLIEQHAIESVAICFLFSYANAAHEQRARELIAERFPDLRVSLSSDILPIIREYRRLSTTAIDAFVGPILSRYLSHLGDGLKTAGVTTPQVFIMQSNGGLMSIDVARANPVQTLLSGPAAGVIAGKHLAEISGSRNLVTFDVGGTSTDVAIIVDGEVSETSEGAIAGHDVSVLMSEISTIGAGGGTIARIGPDKRLKVGPDSAGARPGPACYGHGGTLATVTDANLLLGYLDPATYLGGRFAIDLERARAVMEETIARPLGISVTEAAVAIVKLVNAAMEGELRVNLLQRGHDPRGFALVAIGGGGPLHAAMVGRSLGIESVIVPPYPGLGSAVGLLMTDIRHQYIHSAIQQLDRLDPALFDEMFDMLRQQAVADAQAEGSPLHEVSMQGLLDLRYRGQGYELSVPCEIDMLDDAARARLAEAFHTMHARHYGHAARDKVVEVVNFRLISTRTLPKLAFPAVAEAVPGEIWQPKSRRPVYWEEYGDFLDCPIYDRWAGKRGQQIQGPAIIEQSDTTALVLPGQVAEMGEAGLLVIRTVAIEAAAESASVARLVQGVL